MVRPWFLVLVGCATAGAPDKTPHDAPSSQPDGSGSGGCAFSGVLATWSFAGQPGSQAATSAATSAQGVTATSVSRGTGITASAGSGSINSSNWATTAQRDAGKYYTFAISPSAGCSMSVTSLSVDALASGTGPTRAEVATSTDSFVQSAVVSTTAPSTPTLTVSSTSNSVEIRIYGYSASGTSGTMRLQNTLSVTGALQ